MDPHCTLYITKIAIFPHKHRKNKIQKTPQKCTDFMDQWSFLCHHSAVSKSIIHVLIKFIDSPDNFCIPLHQGLVIANIHYKRITRD